MLSCNHFAGQLTFPCSSYAQGQDLRTGNLTAPAVYALQTAIAPELKDLIQRGFPAEGDLQHAIYLIKHSGGIDAARQLARQEADQVCFPVRLLSVRQCSPLVPLTFALQLTLDCARLPICMAAAGAI